MNRDLPLIVAHIIGGARGVDLSAPLTTEEITFRVAQAIAIADEIGRQLGLRADPPSKMYAQDCS